MGKDCYVSADSASISKGISLQSGLLVDFCPTLIQAARGSPPDPMMSSSILANLHFSREAFVPSGGSTMTVCPTYGLILACFACFLH